MKLSNQPLTRFERNAGKRLVSIYTADGEGTLTAQVHHLPVSRSTIGMARGIAMNNRLTDVTFIVPDGESPTAVYNALQFALISNLFACKR